jgi:Fe2+ or Zn2+ uptake regulation protein
MHDTDTTELVARLRESGRRITRERELLLRIIEENPHLDAGEIYRRARETLPRIGLATVYRTLNLLKELGLVRTIDLGENHGHFELRSEDHVHLVCTVCGRVTDVPVPGALRAAARKRGFVVHRTKLEIFGVCDACVNEGARANASTL